ncbi:MAG TPA: antitoxin Xre/MbcA/ParS toxin-binding domain-containing protein [Verrucomicrobiae bacterium]
MLQELDLLLGEPSPRPTPLDSVKEIIESSRDLRSSRGNLSATAVAEVFGISLSQLAAWLGKSRQALTKTPDADSLQPPLDFFERIARLRLALKSDADFRNWLRTPQATLDNEAPLRLMATHEWQTVVDLVDDMLAGAPV